ncbi:hypothetical protein VB735_19250 [Halotia wernerae UHCC 0503]|nr:hypothetical protein [Halotia wernerae UHCC 0503]
MITIRDYSENDLDEVVELWYRSWTNAFPHLHHPQPFEDWKLRFQKYILLIVRKTPSPRGWGG